jgi:hypothetical protein
MPDDSLAVSTTPAAQRRDDFDTICAAMMGSPRGRWFLLEYARRKRNVDTNRVLAAIERMEKLLLGEPDRQVKEQRIAADAGAEADGAFGCASGSPARVQVLAIAARLHEAAQSLRACGLDAARCEQIEALAASILASPPPQDADEHAPAHAERRIRSGPTRTKIGRTPAYDLLAALEEMSDAERIALFT